MRKKIKSRRNQREILKPINRDAMDFLRPWSNNGKVPMEHGSFLCKSCGKDFANEWALDHHCKNNHKEILSSEIAVDGDLLHVRCRICGAEMQNNDPLKREHMSLHGSKAILDFCSLNGVSNPFEKF